MVEQDTARTEQATPRRKAESRKKGQVALSREVSTAAMLLGAIALLHALAGPTATRLTELMRGWLHMAVEVGARGQIVPETFRHLTHTISLQTLSVTLPFVVPLTAIGAASYLLQTGFLWHSEGLRLDLSRLSPLAGLRRILSLRSAVELLKSIVKITVIAGAAFMAVRADLGRLPELVHYDPAGAMGAITALAFKMGGWIALAAAVIATADYAYQRVEWERSLRMTRQEVKQEHREAEGDPLLRARLRSRRRELMRNRMMAAVPKADVVITNPTHLAVALRYDHATMAAPVVVAKGAGYLAERIKEVASRHGVMVVENPPVAQALFKLVAIGREIPTDLYRAVAEILAFVYRAKGKTPVGGGPRDPDDVAREAGDEP